MKIFCIGFHKTGITSLRSALEVLGYQCCPSSDEFRQETLPGLKSGDLTKVWEVIESYDAFYDNPFPIIFRELDAKYPGSKFILTLRNEEKWIESCLRYFGENKTEMRAWIYGEASPAGNEKIYMERMRQHNQDVVSYFLNRPKDLLSMDIEAGNGWPELCSFLEKPLVTQDFPHLNRTPSE